MVLEVANRSFVVLENRVLRSVVQVAVDRGGIRILAITMLRCLTWIVGLPLFARHGFLGICQRSCAPDCQSHPAVCLM